VSATTNRAHNFSPGPCTLPLPVIEELADELADTGGAGMSVIEMSHRSPEYEAIHHDAIARLRRLYGVPDDVEALLLQGGATMQFAMVPLNLLGWRAAGADPVAAGRERSAGYVLSGAWGQKAYADGAKVGPAYVAWSGEGDGFTRMPAPAEVEVRPETAYLHVTSNETIGGIRLPAFDGFGARLVADMSSDYFSRPIDWEPFDLVYGGVQKNLGPAGLTVVFVRRSVLERSPAELPSYLSYGTHASSASLANTPPVFAVWATGKMLAWIEAEGGLAAMEKRAIDRSGLVYDVIDRSGGFYACPVEPAHRSHVNIVFRLPTEELEAELLAMAEQEQLLNLKGHRSVGGIRVSIYNGLPTASVEVLVAFMERFAQLKG
jgi:phosphoserine aminotransferase